ncbi:MAG: hypothetical protein PHN19_05700 [Patescibacteria group bacterium]|nr:hypothetical protein [Patescibacteria group bacterium]
MANVKMLTDNQIRNILIDQRGLTIELIDQIVALASEYLALRSKKQLINMHLIARCYPGKTAQAVSILLDALQKGQLAEFPDHLVSSQLIAKSKRDLYDTVHNPNLLKIELLEQELSINTSDLGTPKSQQKRGRKLSDIC